MRVPVGTCVGLCFAHIGLNSSAVAESGAALKELTATAAAEECAAEHSLSSRYLAEVDFAVSLALFPSIVSKIFNSKD